MRIAIDIDSTLHHYWDDFAAAAKRRFGVTLPYEDQVTWGIRLLRPEQVKACIAETHSDERVLAATPYPGAVEAVARWHAAGHFIHVTSLRQGHCAAATSEWLRQIGLPHDELYCSFDKISRCREIGSDLLVDDSPVNLHAAVDHGIRGATIVHPWNRKLCETEDIVCAEDWTSLDAKLEPLLTTRRQAA